MIHPDTEVRFISDEIGYGVVAKKMIPKGTITWVLDELDREFTPQEVEALSDPIKNTIDVYAYRNSAGNFILCWDNGRFVNHSFNSNCISTAYDFEIAVRDIEPGEQLTDDYGYLNISEPFRAHAEGTRRKTVYPNDLVKYHHAWDKKLEASFKYILKREQPLGKLLSASQWDKVKAISEGREKMDSILNIYYDEEKVKRGYSSLRKTGD
ncbi:SET domain-containing protein [Owenweeksia hongkongensis]|uniref:SET domain-containing protein n=1 Tax=Owenweeksia hongkongensis TaxID=253245 RepID=UPI003A8CD44F